MSTILLLGGRGQVGWELARALQPLGTLIIPAREQCDLTMPQTLSGFVNQIHPDVIVNAAAYTAVDQAEEKSALAMTINADAPAELAWAARRRGALLVHYSTDYVFDGRKPEPYTEDDAPNPLNAYGRSKLAGERAVCDVGADHLVFRSSWVYAARGKNFLRTVLRLASERETLQVVADQVGAPTWARLIADTTLLALQQDSVRRLNGTFESGVFNLVAAGSTSWHGFATAIVAGARARGAPLKCRDVLPIATSDYPLPAQRPANSRLSGVKLAQRYELTMPTWDSCMDLCLDELRMRDAMAR